MQQLKVWGVILLLLSSCARQRLDQEIKLLPLEFKELSGWQQDEVGEALPAFLNTCKAFNKKPAKTPIGLGTTAGDWHPLCKLAAFTDTKDPHASRKFFQDNFIPYKVYATQNATTTDQGLFTGYFESELKGSRKKTKRFKYALHGKPLKSSKLPPREEILKYGLKSHQGEELIYVDDLVDAFFLHVQGSGRVYLEDGSVIRVGYASANGHPYRSLGQALIDKECLSKEIVSMQSIRRWLKDNPKMADKMMNHNPSYIFFRIIDGDGPIGSQNVPLTPRRSMAVDKRYIPLGVPLWLDVMQPQNEVKFRTLAIAQDTGGAIKGAIRGDFFWGHGSHAFHYAGLMKSKGRYYVLLPKHVRLPGYLLKND